MKETGVIRRRVSGPEAAPYMNVARNLLGMVKQQIQFGGLSQLSRTVDLPNGIRITVMSIFGQDEVRISVPDMPNALGQAAKKISKHKTISEVIYGDYFKWTPKDKNTYIPNLIASDVTKDGLTVVGQDYNLGLAAYWTEKKGFTYIDKTQQSYATATSGDGSIIGGYYVTNAGFIWTNESGAHPIDTDIYGISDDGTVLVGVEFDGNNRASFLWTKDGGKRLIGDFTANNISGDGKVVVGYRIDNNIAFGVKWTEKTGVVDLPHDPKGGIPYTVMYNTVPKAANYDGSVIVGSWTFDAIIPGYTYESLHTHLARWDSTGMTSLGAFYTPWESNNTNDMVATDVSDDGKIIVGTGIHGDDAPSTWYASFRWTEETGIVEINRGLSTRVVIATPTTYYVDGIEVDKKTYDATPN